MEYESSMHGNMRSQKMFSPPQDDHRSPKASKMAKSPNECLTNFMEGVRTIYEISWPIMEYVWKCIEDVLDMHAMCSDMYGTRMEYVWDMHGICVEYAWNIHRL